MEFQDLMKGFGEAFGIADFKPGDDGSWNVEIDGMPVSFSELADPPRMRMRAPVCELPAKGRGALLRVMLESMFMGRATGGAAFALNEGSDSVILHRIDSLQTLGLEAFKELLERFVNILAQWREISARFEPVAGELEKAEQAAVEVSRQMKADGFMRV